MATRMQQRRGTAAQWTAANPILAAGEIGFETDTVKFKMGNGSSTWSALSYFANAAELASIIDGAPDLLNNLNELAAAIGDDPSFFLTVQQDLATHRTDTTQIHGIVDTANLAIKSEVTTEIGTAVSTHNSDTTLVHGIEDTSALVTTTILNSAIATEVTNRDAAVSTHNSDTTQIHGIADTSVLITQTQLSDALSGATVNQSELAGLGIDWNVDNEQFDIDSTVATKTYADDAVSTHNLDSTNVHGIADTAELATKAYADTAEADAITAAGTAADTKISTAVAALTKSSVGLANVDNTADASKPVSTAQATAIATAKSEAIADATSQVNALLTGAPEALNTLDELAAALGDDANFASTVTTSLGLKAPLASPTFTGTVTVAAAGVAFTDGTQTKEGVPSRTSIIAKTDSYTISALTERDSLIEVAKSTATTITIPTDATLDFPVGTSIDILQTSTGQVTIAGASGVTVNSTPGLKLRTQWSSATLFKRAANTWVVYGDLTA